MFKKYIAILLIAILFSSNVLNAEADYTPSYRGYTHDGSGNVVSSPNGYKPETVINGNQIGCGNLKNPEDLFIADNGDIYILDSGNARIVITDKDLKLKKIIDEIKVNGTSQKMKEPMSIYINRSNEILIADKGNARVILIDQDGNMKKEMLRPETALIPETVTFEPIKALEDDKDNIYVISRNIYQGIILYNSSGKFNGFYGNNKVKGSVSAVANYILKKFLTKKQKELSARYVPTEIKSIDINNEGYIYTVAFYSQTEDIIKRLNPKGINTFKMETANSDDSQTVLTSDIILSKFADISIDDDGHIFTLDTESGKIFEFDPYGNKLLVFGGLGLQAGLFRIPSALDVHEGKAYVLDRAKGNLTVFSTTSFGEIVHRAIKLYNEGLYEEAIDPWNDVLKRNANYNLAYIGLGKAYMNLGEYKTAMEYFKQGNSKDGYDEAFQKYRVEVVRKHFGRIATITAILLLLLWIVNKKKITFKKMINQIFKGRSMSV